MYILIKVLLITLTELLLELKITLKIVNKLEEQMNIKELTTIQNSQTKLMVILTLSKETSSLLLKKSQPQNLELVLQMKDLTMPQNLIKISLIELKTDKLNVLKVKWFGKTSIITSKPNFQPPVNLCISLSINTLYQLELDYDFHDKFLRY